MLLQLAASLKAQNDRVVQNLLGHSTINMTADVYTHVSRESEREAAQAVERAIELSKTRYCPVIGMLGKVAAVTTRYEIEEETEPRLAREG